jgi:hypothetical protein
MFLHIIKAYLPPTYSQHYAKWRTTETIPTKVRNVTGVPTFTTPFNIVLEFLTRAIKGIELKKEEAKLYLFLNDKILYTKDSTNFTKKL